MTFTKEERRTQTQILSDMTTVKISLGKIEQHLSDMNGRLTSHDKHILMACPKNRDTIQTRITKLSTAVTRNSVIVTAINTIMVGVLIAIMTGFIHV